MSTLGRYFVALLILMWFPMDAEGQFVRPGVGVPELVREYLEGRQSLELPLEPFAGGGCPSDDARRDSIFTALLQIDSNDAMVVGLAGSWSGLIGRCDEPRLREWFRERIERQTNGFFKAALLRAALVSGLEEYRQLAIDALGDSTISPDSRELVYGFMAQNLSTQQALDVAMVAYERHGATVVRAVATMFAGLPAGSEVIMRRRVVRAVEDRPSGRDAASLLGVVYGSSMSPARRDSAWNAEFTGALDRMLNRPAAEVSSDLRTAMLHMRVGVRPNR